MTDTIGSITKIPSIKMVYSFLSKWGVKGDTILDVGCGHGNASLLMQLMFPEKLLLSCDISEDTCKYVKYGESLRNVICCDATKLPLKDESVALIVCNQLIEHVENENGLVGDLHRVLKRGGHVVVTSVLRKRWGVAFYKNKKGQLMFGADHVREYRSRKQFVALFDPYFAIFETRLVPIPICPFAQIYYLLANLRLIKYNPQFARNPLLGKLSLPRPGVSHIGLIGRKE